VQTFQQHLLREDLHVHCVSRNSSIALRINGAGCKERARPTHLDLVVSVGEQYEKSIEELLEAGQRGGFAAVLGGVLFSFVLVGTGGKVERALLRQVNKDSLQCSDGVECYRGGGVGVLQL
jgi:hypothetical protein